MKTMKKIVAILAVAMMLCSILPLSAFAADTTVVFELGANGSATHADGSSKTTYSETVDGYTLSITGGTNMYTGARDAKGNSCIKLGTSKAVGSFTINVPDDVTSVIVYAGQYKANTTKLSVAGTTYTLSGSSNNGAYDEIVVDTTTTKTIAVTTVSGGIRAMINSITFVIAATGSADCDHASLHCGDTCPECGEYTKEHAFSNNCTAECENGCGTANPDYADHVYGGGEYDEYCDVCNYKREVNFPAADSELTIPEADALGLAMEHNVTTPNKYYVTGTVESIANTAYGNLYIQDEDGNKLYIYGTYSEDGSIRFDAMSVKPQVGMTITVYGVIGNYNNASQMKNAWVTDMVITCEHEYEFDCDKKCSLCGLELRPEAVCVSDAAYACIDGLCIYCGNDVDALEHAFDDEWDADCNYGCGYTREVEEKPEITEDTLDFSTTDQRTEYSTTVQVWQSNGLVLTNNKGGSTSNVGNYSNPARFYKGSEIIIAYPGMTQLVIDASNTGDAKYSTPWGDMLTAAGLTYTVDGKIYTITFAAPVDSITLSCSAQVRANSMTATAEKKGDDGCAHNWIDATCTAPKTCSKCGAVEGAALGHNYVEDIIDATCTAAGSATYECSVCFDSYDETIPMKPHTYVDGICSGCGAELPLEATITFGEDKAQRTEFTTELQKWEHDGLVLINNKAASTTSIGDYAGRFYKGSEIIISFPGMTSLVIDASGVGADYLWDATLEAAGLSFTVEEKIYTITFAEPTDSITLTAANQVRANSITASRVVACAHEYDNACDVDCNLCYETREVSHNVIHVEAVAATCTAMGNIEYWYCDVCGMAWLDAECTTNTNLKAVKLPMAEHTYFDACSAICEVCGYEREVSHNVIHVEAADATCVANGNIEYWYCDACGMAWLDAECTKNTNIKAVKLPATGEHTYDDDYDVDCNVCGDIREVPEEPIVYGDANGDGTVSLLDATLISQHLAGWEVDMNMVSADANGDGTVSLLDATLISQYLAGWEVDMGPEESEQDPEEQGPQFNDGELGEW